MKLRILAYIGAMLSFGMAFQGVHAMEVLRHEDIKQHIERHEACVVMFYRPTCPSCKYVQPLYEEVRRRHADDVAFMSIDLNAYEDRGSSLKKAFDFTTVPTCIYYKGGKEVVRHGSKEKSITVQDMETYIHKITG